MDYQTYIDPNMLHQTNEPEVNEMSFNFNNNQYTIIPSEMTNNNLEWTTTDTFDLSSFQTTTSAETWNNENLEWTTQDDMAFWGDLSLTAAQQDLSQPLSPSGFSKIYIPFEDFEQLFYPQPQVPPSSDSTFEFLDLEGLSPSTSSETPSSSSQPTSTSSQSSSPTSSSSDSSSVFNCNYCNKSFPKRHLLNRHEKQHTKPITCPISGCSHSTAKSRDMQRHITVHHRESDEVPRFRCAVGGCGREFKRKDHLVRHVRRAHGGTSVG